MKGSNRFTNYLKVVYALNNKISKPEFMKLAKDFCGDKIQAEKWFLRFIQNPMEFTAIICPIEFGEMLFNFAEEKAKEYSNAAGQEYNLSI